MCGKDAFPLQYVGECAFQLRMPCTCGLLKIFSMLAFVFQCSAEVCGMLVTVTCLYNHFVHKVATLTVPINLT